MELATPNAAPPAPGPGEQDHRLPDAQPAVRSKAKSGAKRAADYAQEFRNEGFVAIGQRLRCQP